MDILLQQIINGLVLGSMYALIALGYTMVYGIIQLINFAHGEVLMIGALTSWSCIGMMQEAMPGAPGWVILLLATLIGLGLSFGAGGAMLLAAASNLTMASVRCGWTAVGCAGTATSAGTTCTGVSARAVAVAAAAPAITYERIETDTMAPRNDRVPTL